MEENKKNNTSLIVLICLIVAVLVCCAFLVFKNLTKNATPKNMFVNGIENAFKFEKSTKEFDTIKAKVNVSLNLKTDLVEKDILDLINKLNLTVNADVDMKNKLASIGIDTKYDKDEVVNAKMYYEDNSLYVFLNDIYNKWIKVDTSEMNIDDFSTSFTMNQEEIDLEQVETLVEEVKNALLDSLNDEYFTKEKDDDSTKVTLTITKDNILDIINDFVKNLKNNSKFKDVAKKMLGADMDTLLDQVSESLKQITKNDFASLEDVKVVMYLNKDNKIEKISIDTTMEKQPIKLEIETNEKNFSISMYMMGIKMIELSVKQDTNGDATKCVVKFSITGMLELTANIEYSIKYNEKVDKVDVSNSINMEDITETEGNAIVNKLMKSKGLNKLLEAIQKVIPQDDYNYQLNY